MSTRFRIPSRPILPQQLADILDRLDEVEGVRGGGIGGIGVGGVGGGIGGSGYPNILAKWATSSSLTDSHFTDSGSDTQLVYGSDAEPAPSPLGIFAYGLSGGVPVTSHLVMAYARGIRSAPAAVQFADILGLVIVKGCDYAGHFSNSAAQILFNTAEDWTATAHGTNILFYTTPLGDVVQRARICINASGFLVLYQPNSPYTGAIIFRVPTDIATSHFYTLPTARPAVSGYYLSCTTDGKMSWIAGGGGIGGSGTAGYIPKFIAPATLGDSIMYVSVDTVFITGGLSASSDIVTSANFGCIIARHAMTDLVKASAPSSPTSAYVRLYAKTDNKLYYKDSLGAETGPLGAGGMVAHPLLGVTWHSDVSGQSAALGALMIGNASNKWGALSHPGIAGCLLVTLLSGSYYYYHLLPGTAGYVLTMVAGYPSWQPAAGGGVSAITARAYQTAEQTLPNGSGQWISFDTQYYDTDGMFTPPDTKIYAKRLSGYYLVDAYVEFKPNATGFRYALLCKNDATYLTADENPAIPGWETMCHVSSVVYLAVNDYVRVMAYQNSGGNLNTAACSFCTWMSLTYLSS